MSWGFVSVQHLSSTQQLLNSNRIGIETTRICGTASTLVVMAEHALALLARAIRSACLGSSGGIAAFDVLLGEKHWDYSLKMTIITMERNSTHQWANCRLQYSDSGRLKTGYNSKHNHQSFLLDRHRRFLLLLHGNASFTDLTHD